MRSFLRSLVKNYGWVFLLLFAGFFLAHGAYHRHNNASEVKWDVAYEMDEQLPGNLPEQIQPSESTKLTLVVFLKPVPITNRIKYLGAVDRVHKENGLRIIGILPEGGTIPDVSFEIIQDKDLIIHSVFRVAADHPHSGFVLFDSEGRVKVHFFGIPDEDEIRQLVEKYLLGKVDYEYRRRRPAFSKGQDLAAGHFRILEDEQKNPKMEGRTLIFFPPGCSSCKANSYAGQVANLSRATKSRKGKGRLVAVLPNEGGTVEWESLSALISPFVDEIWLTQNAGLVWDDYYTRYVDSDLAPVVVRTGNDGKVLSVMSLSEAMAHGGVK